MNKYRIAYIDEDGQDIRNFQRYVIKLGDNNFEVIPIYPIPEIETLIEKIFESEIEALVVDFNLNEHNNKIHYFGTDITEKILNERDGFPVFVFTSWSDNAEERGDDVNIVYEKKLMFENNPKFLDRVKFQIEKYHHKLDEKEKKLLQLLKEKNERELSSSEEDEIMKLNYSIEKALNKTIAKKFTPTNEKRLIELIEKIDTMIEKINK